MSPEEILENLPRFMGMDMVNIKKNRGKMAVILIDTHESLFENFSGSDEKKKNVDEWIRELIRSIPNTIFVIAGREKPDWWEEDMNLAVKSLDTLSEKDSKEYLKNSGVDEEHWDMIYRNVKGFPFGLELAVWIYRAKEEKNEKITEEDFRVEKGDYKEMAERFLRHISRNESDTIKLLSLCEWWDYEIFRALTHEFRLNMSKLDFGRITRFSFIECIDEERKRYTLHQIMRDTVSSHLVDKDIKSEVYAVLKGYFLKKSDYKSLKEIDEKKSRGYGGIYKICSKKRVQRGRNEKSPIFCF